MPLTRLLYVALAALAIAQPAVGQHRARTGDEVDSRELMAVWLVPAAIAGPAVLWSRTTGRLEMPVASAGVVGGLAGGTVGAAAFAELGANLRLVDEWYVGAAAFVITIEAPFPDLVLRTGFVRPGSGRVDLSWSVRRMLPRLQFTVRQF